MPRTTKGKDVDFSSFFDSLETEKELNQTFNGDVDYPEDRPLIDYNQVEEDMLNFGEEEDEELELEPEAEPEHFSESSEYSDEDIEQLMTKVSLKQRKKSKHSFDELVPPKKEKTGIKMQNKENKVHHLLILREVVELTPSVCRRPNCTYDASVAWGFKKWGDVPKSKQRLIIETLKRHREQEHKFVNETIVDKADIASSWLSPHLS